MAKKGTFPANAMRRGEIYWVDIPNAIGHELMKDRPAIIVSCDALNDNSPVVQEMCIRDSRGTMRVGRLPHQGPGETLAGRSTLAGHSDFDKGEFL